MSEWPASNSPAGGTSDRCPAHPDRPAYVRCQRCGRPVCPACQVTAAVGVQCVDCVASDNVAARRQSGLGVRPGPPVVTITLIAVCVAVAVVGMVWPSGDLTGTLGFMPILARHEPWRWLTSMFDHLGLMHLAMNMICLWMLGVFLEPALGRWRFTALYLLSGLGGGTAILAWTAMGGLSLDWFGLSAGASGAVFGLFGATVWVMRRLGGNLRGILVVLGINLVFTVANTATVAWQAHIGGLLVGLALGAVYAYAPRARARLFSLLGTAGAVVVVVGVYLAISTAIPNLAGLL